MIISRIIDQGIIKDFITSPEIWGIIAQDDQSKDHFISRNIDTEAEIHLGWYTKQGDLVGLLIAHKTLISAAYKAFEVHLNILPSYSKDAYRFSAEAQLLLSEYTDYLYCEVPSDSRIEKFIQRDNFVFVGTASDVFKKNSIENAVKCYLKKLK